MKKLHSYKGWTVQLKSGELIGGPRLLICSTRDNARKLKRANKHGREARVIRVQVDIRG